jgi:hypothetical protein
VYRDGFSETQLPEVEQYECAPIEEVLLCAKRWAGKIAPIKLVYAALNKGSGERFFVHKQQAIVVGSAVSIFSDSAASWMDGKVSRVFAGNRTVTVEYGNGRTKDVHLDDSDLYAYFKPKAARAVGFKNVPPGTVIESFSETQTSAGSARRRPRRAALRPEIYVSAPALTYLDGKRARLTRATAAQDQPAGVLHGQHDLRYLHLQARALHRRREQGARCPVLCTPCLHAHPALCPAHCRARRPARAARAEVCRGAPAAGGRRRGRAARGGGGAAVGVPGLQLRHVLGLPQPRLLVRVPPPPLPGPR